MHCTYTHRPPGIGCWLVEKTTALDQAQIDRLYITLVHTYTEAARYYSQEKINPTDTQVINSLSATAQQILNDNYKLITGMSTL